MSEKPHDAPAFPSPTGNPNQDGQLTVRDYFAGQALIGLFCCETSVAATIKEAASRNIPWSQCVAASCYELAAALLKERPK